MSSDSCANNLRDELGSQASRRTRSSRGGDRGNRDEETEEGNRGNGSPTGSAGRQADYRLNVFAIQLPSLRDRREDILPLTEAFLAEFSQRFGKPPAGVSRDARRILLDHHWPGNVRELRNTLERAAILCEGGLITPEHLPAKMTASRPTVPAAASSIASTLTPPMTAAPPAAAAGDISTVERAMIEQALQTTRFNKSKTARMLGLTRQQLYVRMRKYGLE